MQEIRLARWADFVDQADAHPGWAFRGESHADWPLVPSLARELAQRCPAREQWPARELRAWRIFRRKAHNHVADRGLLDDDLRCLALMQHHGAPTRLLDFSKSPFVAAFFALEGAWQEAAVYALDTPTLWTAVPRAAPRLARHRVDLRVPGRFARYFAANRWPLVWSGEPTWMDRRLVAQSGLFVVPGRLDLPLDALLAQLEPAPRLVKLVLPAALREEAMRMLYRMNITHATLFPDLEGLARATRYELEVVWERLADGRDEA